VALEATFRGMVMLFQRLSDELYVLRKMVEDRPPESDSSLVDQLENTVLDITGLLNEAMESAHEALSATGHPVDMDRARRALARCQDCFHRVEHHYSADLTSYKRLKHLAILGKRRGGECLPWASGARAGMEQWRDLLEEVSRAMSACWQELAERPGGVSVSVQATNIGQHIARTRERAELDVEGVT
jgi:hypothetical protein